MIPCLADHSVQLAVCTKHCPKTLVNWIDPQKRNSGGTIRLSLGFCLDSQPWRRMASRKPRPGLRILIQPRLSHARSCDQCGSKAASFLERVRKTVCDSFFRGKDPWERVNIRRRKRACQEAQSRDPAERERATLQAIPQACVEHARLQDMASIRESGGLVAHGRSPHGRSPFLLGLEAGATKREQRLLKNQTNERRREYSQRGVNLGELSRRLSHPWNYAAHTSLL